MARDPFQLVGTTIAGKYRVDRVLGEGGCGIVYLGQHLVVGVPVAIKCLKPLGGDRELEQRVTQLFLREAKVLFSLTHPGIVRLYDVGALETSIYSVPYVVLEYIDGPTLEEEIANRARESRHFSANELLALFEPVLDAVAFAHENGVAHRDLKPSNIMLPRVAPGSSPTAPRVAKVVDFGIARRLGEQRQTLGVSGFTPRYAAPEQWDNTLGQTGPASDVFSLGLILTEACTLKPALGAAGAAGLVAAVLDPNRRSNIARDRPDLGQEIDRVIERATRVRREDRYQGARELLQALRAALATQAIGMQPTVLPRITAPSPIGTSGNASSQDMLPSAQTSQPATYTPHHGVPSHPPGYASAPPVGSAPANVAGPAPHPRSNAPLLLGMGGVLVALVAVIALVVVATTKRGNDDPPKTATTSAKEKTAPATDDTQPTTTKTKKKKKPTAPVDDDDDDEAFLDEPSDKKPNAPVKPKAGSGPSVIVGMLMAGDHYTDAQIYAVAEKQSGPVLDCYKKYQEKHPGFEGRISLIVTVEPTGRVEVMAGTDGPAEKSFSTCVAAKVSAWKFPKPYPADDDDIMMGLDFAP